MLSQDIESISGMPKVVFAQYAKRFVASEKGAITVDYVVLTAGLVGLGVAVTAAVQPGVGRGADSIAEVMWAAGDHLSLLPTLRFDDFSMMTEANRTYYGYNGAYLAEYQGWENRTGAAFEFEVDSDGNGLIDMESGNGQHMSLGRTLDDAVDGQSYTLSLSAFDRSTENYATVTWGGRGRGYRRSYG